MNNSFNNAFSRPHLDYGDTIYDKVYNACFHQKFELYQYSSCLALSGAIRDTSKEKFYRGRFGVPSTFTLVKKARLFLQYL